jgi:hypothetical protein
MRKYCILVCVVCALGLVALHLAHQRNTAASQEPRQDFVNSAFEFIATEHDRFHKQFIIYDDRDSGGAHFFSSGWMGDFSTVSKETAKLVLDDRYSDTKFEGITCIRLRYPRVQASQGWAGIYWQFPDGNWNKSGYDLRRYLVPGVEDVKLKFWVKGNGEIAEFKSGGMDGDSYGPVGTGTIRIGKEWTEQSINLTGQNLRSVAGGFCWVTNDNPGKWEILLDSIRIEFGPKGTAKRLAEPRFVRSYVPLQAGEPDKFFRNACYTYDNSLIVLALCARRQKEDIDRARLICDAFHYAQQHDLTPDGRLRNAYACGDLSDPSQNGIPRLPGWWDDDKGKWIQDAYFASTDCGNMAWAAIGLLTFWETTGREKDSKYLTAATKVCEWIHKNGFSDSGLGGYTGGVDAVEKSMESPEGQRRVSWKSTEHNIDCFVAFSRLFAASRDPVWKQRAEHAQRFVERMIDPAEKKLWTGTADDGKTINQDLVPLDVAPWALLAFRDAKQFGTAVRWADKHCWVNGTAQNPKLRGFDFNADDGDGVWWEGTSQMQLALRYLGDNQRAAECLDVLRTLGKAPSTKGAILAASHDGVTTGFVKEWGPWLYWARPQTGGATCWYIFAEMGWNPYWNEPIGKAAK